MATRDSLTARRARLDALTDTPFDTLVVGGGITGAGIARDLALRGLKVALVEKGDYASGTSSKSSKLIHGGLRYLENFEFGLVFEALRERRRQLVMNPHLVWPQPFVFPVYKGDKNSLFKINIGLWLYDLLSLFRSPKLHKKWRAAKTLEQAPGLRAEALTGSVHYYDCGTDDARLTLANVLDAERQGGVCANYVRFVEPRVAEGQVTGALLADELTGAQLELSCRTIVYAGGPWTDKLAEAAGEGRLLRPTKGVHVVVARERLPVEHAIVMSAVADGRVVFAIPYGNTTYIGTTDTDYDGDLDEVRTTSDDIEYLLSTTNHFFPQAHLEPQDVRSTWAGLRPLIRDEADNPYKTSREHQVYTDDRGLFTIAGGKLTTYRSMAEECVDKVVKRLDKRHQVEAGRCTTHKLALDRELPAKPEGGRELMLWRTHGSAMGPIAQAARETPAEGELLSEDLDYIMAQVSWATRHEHAETLEDMLVRRLQVFYRAADQGIGCARKVAARMAELLGHDSAWIESQVATYGQLVELSRRGVRALAAEPADGVAA